MNHLRVPPNREALRLYRDIIRAARTFNFPNEQGDLWFVLRIAAAAQRSVFPLPLRHRSQTYAAGRMF